MIIEIFRGTNSQYYFRIKARNGRIIAQSEGYKRKQAISRTFKTFYKGWVSFKVKDLTK